MMKYLELKNRRSLSEYHLHIMQKRKGSKSALKMTDTKGSTSVSPDIHALQKEWDDISCPICMEHPHNAVLLICSSHEKGCRSYICDTSYRHSNCLDRFKKLKVEHSSDHHHSQSISSFHEQAVTERSSPRIPLAHGSEQSLGSPRMRTIENTDQDMLEVFNEHNHSLQHRHLEGQAEESVNLGESRVRNTLEQNSLRCPLCRGTVTGRRIVKESRQYLDLKPRSCSRESCSFSGNYGELRRHARRDHPTTRPADVDPSRQHAWRHLEQQREYGDILSAIRSAMPGAVMFGDYIINDEDVLSHDRELGSDTGPWWATLFLFHMMSGPIGSHDEFGSSSRTWRVRRRSSSPNHSLWGENLLGLQDDHDDDDEIVTPRRRRVTRLGENSFSRLQDDHDDNEERPRRRRRTTRSRPDGDRP